MKPQHVICPELQEWEELIETINGEQYVIGCQRDAWSGYRLLPGVGRIRYAPTRESLIEKLMEMFSG